MELSRLDEFKKPETNVNMNNNRLTNLKDPVDNNDAVTNQTLLYHVNDIALAMGPKNVSGNSISGINGLHITKDSGLIF